MIRIKNRYLPFKGFKALNFCGLVLYRDDVTMLPHDWNHEKIHGQQIKELWYVGFYIAYLFEWIFRLFQHGFRWKRAYYTTSFEAESYANQYDYKYLETRKPFAMWRK